MNKTSIEWTDFTWNPIRARLKGQGPKVRGGTFCTRISPGCTNCYASVINQRFGNGLEYTVPNLDKVEFFLDDKILQEPVRRKKPARIFVGDMFDLFHEAIPQEMIAEVLRVAWKLPRHTFQFLTKRAERMQRMITGMMGKWGEPGQQPPAQMWFGVSVEDQPRADERISLLLQTPAAVRFLSVEPQLEAITMDGIKGTGWWIECPRCGGACSVPCEDGGGKPCPRCFGEDGLSHQGVVAGIHWLICGGESGPKARPFNLAWAESLRKQCKEAGVSFFLKQLGSKPVRDIGDADDCQLKLNDRKGGDPAEWPESLRVREYPQIS